MNDYGENPFFQFHLSFRNSNLGILCVLWKALFILNLIEKHITKSLLMRLVVCWFCWKRNKSVHWPQCATLNAQTISCCYYEKCQFALRLWAGFLLASFACGFFFERFFMLSCKFWTTHTQTVSFVINREGGKVYTGYFWKIIHDRTRFIYYTPRKIQPIIPNVLFVLSCPCLSTKIFQFLKCWSLNELLMKSRVLHDLN